MLWPFFAVSISFFHPKPLSQDKQDKQDNHCRKQASKQTKTNIYARESGIREQQWKVDNVSDYELSVSSSDSNLTARSYAPLFFWFFTSPRLGVPFRAIPIKTILTLLFLSLLLLISRTTPWEPEKDISMFFYKPMELLCLPSFLLSLPPPQNLNRPIPFHSPSFLPSLLPNLPPSLFHRLSSEPWSNRVRLSLSLSWPCNGQPTLLPSPWSLLVTLSLSSFWLSLPFLLIRSFLHRSPHPLTIRFTFFFNSWIALFCLVQTLGFRLFSEACV